MKGFMELTFGISVSWGRAAGQAGGVVAGRFFFEVTGASGREVSYAL